MASFIAQENRFEGAATTVPPADGHAHVAVVNAVTGEIEACDGGDFGAKYGANPADGVYVISPDGTVDTLKSGTPSTLTITKAGGLGSANPIIASVTVPALTGTPYTSLVFNGSGARTDTGGSSRGVLYKAGTSDTPAFSESLQLTSASFTTLSIVNTISGNITGSAGYATTAATANSAYAWVTPATVNGVSLNGGSNITVTADAGTLTGTTLKATVTGSSLTSVGVIGSGTWQGTAITDTYISGLPWSKLTSGVPTTLSGFGITAGEGTSGYVLKSNGGVSQPEWVSIGSVVGGAELKVANGGNITLAVSGSPSTALLNTATITAGWTGQLSVGNGGTGGTIFNTNGVIIGNGTSNLTATAVSGSPLYPLFGDAPPRFRAIASADLPATITGLTSVSATTLSGALSGNASTATTLQTARNINGVSFNGSSDITVTAAAGTLSGSTLSSGVTGSSLTSVGTISSGTWSGTAISVAKGGTGGDATTFTANRVILGNGASGLTTAAAPGGTSHALFGSATPAFRAIDATDVPNLSASKITSGVLAVDRGGTGMDSSNYTTGDIITAVSSSVLSVTSGTTIGKALVSQGVAAVSVYKGGPWILVEGNKSLKGIAANTYTASVTIPSGGKDIKVVIRGRCTGGAASAVGSIYIRFSGSTAADYSSQSCYGSAGATGAGTDTGVAYGVYTGPFYALTAGTTYGLHDVLIANYGNTTRAKTSISYFGTGRNSTSGNSITGTSTGTWTQTSAITSVAVGSQTYAFANEDECCFDVYVRYA